MKKIINRKKYDTETATLIASYSNGLSASDFNCLREQLYRKRNGEYFLYGVGGARTQYAEHSAGCFTGGDGVTLFTEDDAMNWVEKYANDKFEEIFGEVSE